MRNLQSAQEEERAEIARDLHDEVGPYLFALQVDAKAIAKIDTPEAARLGASVREAVMHIQQHVRDILRQLRPVTQLEFGLEAAVARPRRLLVAAQSRRSGSSSTSAWRWRRAGGRRKPPTASCRKASAMPCVMAART